MKIPIFGYNCFPNTSMKELEKKVSYYKKPAELSSEEYQIRLRMQMGENHPFLVKNVGNHPYYSDYLVQNPQNGNTYKVAIRDFSFNRNFCSCLDFRTNQLGVCKHIAAVLHDIQQQFPEREESFIGSYSSIYVDYKNGRSVKLKIGTAHTEAYQALAKRYFDNHLSLLGTSFPVFETLLKEAKAISPDFVCYEDAMAFVLETRDNLKRRLAVLEALSKKNQKKIFEQILKTDLFPFQLEGVQFASLAGRSLIADEMGLGKTIQALAMAELYKYLFKISKVLIVCPTSLKYQWKSEIERFTHSSVQVIEGSSEARKRQLKNSEAFYLITSYTAISNDVEDDLGLDLVILDEAQRIKNWSTKVATNVKKLHSPYAVVLTGTPLENKLEELYSIMQFVDVWQLGPLYRFLDDHRVIDEQTQKVVGYKNLNDISEQLSDTLLRRLKKDVASQLPERNNKTFLVGLTPEQKELHHKWSEQVVCLLSKWRKSGFLGEKDRQLMILYLSKMRMVCDSTYVVDQTTKHHTKIQELSTILEEYLENTDNKVVIFTQWERMARCISEELDAKQISYEYLYGGLSAVKRTQVIESFNQDREKRVFISTDAGSVGLNLQSANMVINVDVPWNPAVLEQRVARVFRIGQKHNVTVINLVASGSIEENMLKVLQFKAGMASGILDDGEDTIFWDNDRFTQFVETVEQLTEKNEDHDEERVEISQNQWLLAFHSELSKVWAVEEQRKQLIDSITETDLENNVFLKLPITGKKELENAISGLLQLFGNQKGEA